MQDTKLSFSEEELEAMHNSRFFVVKNATTEKIICLLGGLEKKLMEKMTRSSILLRPELKIKEKGKIFRGENYRLMPYLVLDCPRVFNTETVFAFRSMFRWGHEFSFTLHLQGQALEIFREKIQQNISMLSGRDFFICVNDTPWEYTFDETNYVPLDNMLEHKPVETKALLHTKVFMKLSRKLELKDHERVIEYGAETFDLVMNVFH